MVCTSAIFVLFRRTPSSVFELNLVKYKFVVERKKCSVVMVLVRINTINVIVKYTKTVIF